MTQQQINTIAKSKSPQQAAKVLGVSEDRVYHFLKEGRLLATKFRGMWCIDPDSLQEFAQQDRRPGNPNFGK